ncbi:MAG TPA: CCA tRNA nucleotidyltransferase [Campylobacterales bacterium]|nr:CCA tRNA nucleotidyltransferase [Campylobacterales bacterium]
MKPLLDENSRQTLTLISNALKGAKLYFAGGCVRDALLGVPSKDFDIEVYNISQSDFEKAIESIGAIGVGKSFFVYRLGNFDISLPRVESKVGVGHTAFEASVTDDMRLACVRRDFTINSMLLSVDNGELFDFYGGMEDLKSRVLRATSERSFAEDSLRVLRAMQFAARFGMRIESATVQMCTDTDLSDMSTSRIFAEFEKMFEAQYPIVGVYYLFKLKIAKKIFALDIDFVQFIKIAKNLRRSYEYFGNPPVGLFLYVIFSVVKINKNGFLDKIGAPNTYRKLFAVQKMAPKRIGDRFLVGLSLKMPICEWLGAYRDGVKERAARLGIWDEPYRPGASHQKMIAKGFVGGEISRNYKIELSREIRENFGS